MSFFTAIIVRTAIAVSVIVLVLLPSESLQRDEAELDSFHLLDIPLFLMPIEEAVDVFRDNSLQACLDSQMPVWRLYFHMNYLNAEASTPYVAEEFIRSARIFQEAFGYGYVLVAAHTFIDDPEKARLFWKVRICLSECKKRMREKNDRSPEIGKILEQSVDELRGSGIEGHASNYFETVADYFFGTAQDDKAFDYLEEAYRLASSSGHLTTATHLAGKIGAYHARMNRLEEAERAYAESLDYARRLGDHYSIARALAFTAQLRATQLRFVEAEELYYQALDQCACIEDLICEATFLYGLAKLYNSFGYPERAIHLCERVILLAQRNLESAIERGDFLHERALEKCLTGARSLLAQLEQDRGNLIQAIQIMEKVLPLSDTFTDRLYHADLLKTTGDMHLAASMPEEAGRYFDEALTVFRNLRKRRHEAMCLLSIAELEIEQRDFERVDRLLERAGEIAEDEDFQDLLIEVVHSRGMAAARREHLEEAVILLESAVTLFERASLSIPHEKNKHALAARMAGIYSDLFVLQSRRPEWSDSLLFWSEKQKQEVYGRPEEAPDDIERMIRRLIEHRGWLPDGLAVIRHIVTDELLIGVCFDKERSVHYSIPVSSMELEERAREFFELCTPDCNVHAAACGDQGELSREMYRLLLGPISEFLEDHRLICFIQDEPLGSFPPSSLIELDGEGRFLVERKLIVSSPSILDLYEAYRNETLREGAEIYSSPLLVGIEDLAPGIGRVIPNLKSLHHTRDEVEQIVNMLGSGVVLTGTDATPSSFLEKAEKADLIHIAAHSIQFPRYSGDSALILSTIESSSSHFESSLLFEDSIRELDLSGTKLVVLSSCETASCAESGTGTGAGLAHAFFQAGAGSVIATTWPIEDHSASVVMPTIYREILEGGRNVAEAIAMVQRRMIEEDRASGNPLQRMHIWAPYIALSSIGPEP